MRRILSPDMFNLARQVRAATDHAANAAGRLAGVTRAPDRPLSVRRT